MESFNNIADPGPSNQEYSRTNSREVIRNPLNLIRHGALCVSDFTRQLWCEKQLVYDLKRLSPPPKSNDAIRGRILHKERDLEVHNYVEVVANTWEDIYALKILRLIGALYEFRNVLSQSQREVPVFGIVDGVFILGTIDELRLDAEDFAIELVEFKTKRRRIGPGMAEIKKHSIQAMMYKMLFDDIIRGNIPYREFRNLGYDLNKYFNKEVSDYICAQMGFLKEIPDYQGNCEWNLNMLLKTVKNFAEGLPYISRCFIDYTWQVSRETYLLHEVEYDVPWLMSEIGTCLPYWKGEREAIGVDVEEAWKCRQCYYSDKCPFELERKTLRERHGDSEENIIANRHRRREDRDRGNKRARIRIEYDEN